ncbi:MAG: DEAD/DEAH box helicase [Polyangiales bacterium]
MSELELAPTEAQTALFQRWIEDVDDLLLVAPTGSGKTFAVALPLLCSIDAHRANHLAHGTAALVLAPTRALVEQHAATLEAIARGLSALDRRDGLIREPLTVAARTGDTKAAERSSQKKSPPAVLVLTPESLAVLLATDAREGLAGVTSVWLDEVHQLCAHKRGALLSTTLAALDRLVSARCGQRPRRVASTATASPVHAIRRWISGANAPPASLVEAGTFRPPELSVLIPACDQPFPGAGFSARKLLPAVARTIASAPGCTMMFVSSRPRAEAWTQALRDVLPTSMPVACFHGSMSADERGLVALKLRRGELRAVVATSSLEAGIDVPDADQVLFLGAPTTVTQAVQSAGRSRHRPDAMPRAVIACTDVADVIDAIAVRRCASRGEIEPAALREGDEDVLVQAVLAQCALAPARPDELLVALKSASAFAELNEDTLFQVIEHLRTGGEALSAYDAAHRIALEPESDAFSLCDSAARRAYLRAIGTIVDDPAVEVVFASRLIGRIEGRFAQGLEVGDRFALAGSVWKILARTPERVEVSRDDKGRGPVARWTGARMTRSELVSREVARCYAALDRECAHEINTSDSDALLGALGDELSVDRATAALLAKWTRAQRAVSAVPTAERLVLECVRGRTTDTLVLFTFAGWSANEAIARASAERWRAHTGAGCEFSASDIGLALTLPRRASLRASRADEALSLFAPNALRAVLRRTLDGSMLAKSTFREVARVAQLSTADTRPGGATPGLLYDVLRKHAPGHLLLSALDRSIMAALDVDRAERALRSLAAQPHVPFFVLDAPSPMSVPVLARGERTTDRVAPDDLDGALARVAHELWLRSGAAELP